MKTSELLESVLRLMGEKNFSRAEELLLAALAKAVLERNSEAAETILRELVDLLCIKEPANLARAEAFLHEMASIKPSAQNKLKVAMFAYQMKHDLTEAERLLREAIARGNEEQDSRTTYFALSVLGTILLDKGRIDEAALTLVELNKIITQGKVFVAGDEAGFLEKALERGLDPLLIHRIAQSSLRICRDPAFRGRLERILQV